METQILEGTFTEVQRRLSALPLQPETRLRVVVSESDVPNIPGTTNAIADNMRNGLIMLPAPGLTTLEEVQDTLYSADMADALGEDEEKMLQTLKDNAPSNIVAEPETEDTQAVKPFTATEFRNGLPLLPRRKLPEPITIELVKRLSEDADEEVLSAYRTAGC